MRHWLVPTLALALLLTACGGMKAAPASEPPSLKAPAPTAVAEQAPPAQSAAKPETDGATTPAQAAAVEPGCPPSPPVWHKGPPPESVRVRLSPERPVADRDQPLRFTLSIENVHRFPVTMGQASVSLQLRRLGNDAAVPVWQQPVANWSGVTLQPGQSLTASATWPGGAPGHYSLSWDRLDFTPACTGANYQASSGPGGELLEVLPPAGAVASLTLEPKRSVTVDDITVRVDRVEMSRERTRVSLWVSGLRAPAELHVSLLRDGSTPAYGTGLANRDAEGGGVLVWADFEPTPVGTHSLTLEVSDIGLTTPGVGMHYVHGPWRLVLQL